jgi:hypothetical protein
MQMRSYPVYHAVILCCLFVPLIAKSQLQKIYLNPKAPGIGKQSQFVDSIKFIPLEIKEGIELGAYNNIQVTEKYFMIIDYPEKTLLLYSKNGSFIRKISYKKLGENFYPSYKAPTNQIVFFGINKNYTLTPNDMLKIKLDWNNPSNKKYFKKYTIDLNDTSFITKKVVADENDIVYAGCFYDDVYLQGQIITSPLFNDSLDYELKIYKNKQLIKSFFPYNRINEPKFLYVGGHIAFNLTDAPHIVFFSRPYCDTIYKLNKDSLSPAYQLVLPLENSLPTSFFTKPFKNRAERENFERNNGWILRQIHNFYETPTFVFFLVSYLSNSDLYIYQKQTNTTYKTKNIKPDSSQYNLQLLGDFSTIRQGNYFYKAQKASDLVTFFKQHKNMVVPKELESFLKSNPPVNSPVIVEFKLKN